MIVPAITLLRHRPSVDGPGPYAGNGRPGYVDGAAHRVIARMITSETPTTTAATPMNKGYAGLLSPQAMHFARIVHSSDD